MVQRKYHRQVFQKKKSAKVFSLFIKFGLVFVLLTLLFIFSLFVFFAKDLPRPERFTERPFVESTKIYDRAGKTLLYEVYGEDKRGVIPLSTIPGYLKQAVILTEDANFYKHRGLDWRGIFRAFLVNLELQAPIQGGSTISQQLIRSSFLTREKTLKRKIREIILTLELERRYSKDQILEWYLNQVPFGSNSYGVEAASQSFFQKSASQVTLAEAAVLAALIRAPSDLSPYGEHKKELLERKDFILNSMAQTGAISQEEAEKAKKEEISFTGISQSIGAPHFVMYVLEYLRSNYGEDALKEKGFRVITSIDWDLQKLAEGVVKEGAERNKAYRAFNAALVAINPQTGEILSMVGSKDFFGEPEPNGCTPGKNCLFEPEFNVALGGKKFPGRQPGSAFKPFVYATAFNKGYSDLTVVVDEPTNFGAFGGEPYIPQNYDGLFRGPVTLRQALAQSLNVPSVKVLAYLAGLEDSIQTAKDLGITTLTRPASFYGLPLVLGGGEVKLLDMVSAYGVFAAEGMKVPPVSILKITDAQGNIVEENKRAPKRVLDAAVAELITDILSDNAARAPIFGVNSVMHFEGVKVAAKTGTTESFKDGWIIGYAQNFSVGVWAGNNNGAPMLQEPGIVVAGPIWRVFLEKALTLF